MDGEWFIKWSPEVGSDDDSVLQYELADESDYDLDVTGIESAKLTVNT